MSALPPMVHFSKVSRRPSTSLMRTGSDWTLHRFERPPPVGLAVVGVPRAEAAGAQPVLVTALLTGGEGGVGEEGVDGGVGDAGEVGADGGAVPLRRLPAEAPDAAGDEVAVVPRVDVEGGQAGRRVPDHPRQASTRHIRIHITRRQYQIF